MCYQNINFDDEESLDEDLLNLFKKFKEINESEAGEPLNTETLKVDFVNTIQEKISELVDDDEEIKERIIK